MISQGINLPALENELQAVEFQILLYDAAMNALNEIESGFIRIYYEKGMSFREMSEIGLIPNRQSRYSESTLKRMHRVILCKISSVLDSLRGEESLLRLQGMQASSTQYRTMKQ